MQDSFKMKYISINSVHFGLQNKTIMIGIKFLVLCLKALEILSSECAGWGCSPWYIKPQIVGGNIIKPDEYSWIASLQYAKQARFGICAGSVINSWNVLTAAHCVTGEKEVTHGKL